MRHLCVVFCDAEGGTQHPTRVGASTLPQPSCRCDISGCLRDPAVCPNTVTSVAGRSQQAEPVVSLGFCDKAHKPGQLQTTGTDPLSPGAWSPRSRSGQGHAPCAGSREALPVPWLVGMSLVCPTPHSHLPVSVPISLFLQGSPYGSRTSSCHLHRPVSKRGPGQPRARTRMGRALWGVTCRWHVGGPTAHAWATCFLWVTCYWQQP